MPLDFLVNWNTQIRKGYLELCILSLISAKGQSYGFEIIEELKKLDLPIKEGTLYPLLTRMTNEEILQAHWETENIKGHPKKYYSLTKKGEGIHKEMNNEFKRMISIKKTLLNGGKK